MGKIYYVSNVPKKNSQRPLEQSRVLTLDRYLNEYVCYPTGERVVRIVEACKSYTSEAGGAMPDAPMGATAPVFATKEAASRWFQILRLVDRYRFKLQIYPFSDPLIKHGRNILYAPELTADGFESTGPFVEALMVVDVVGRFKSDGLDRLRRCNLQQCNRWFLATKSTQNYCTIKCRKFVYEKTDGYKEHRREYMQKRYRDHFSGRRKKAVSSRSRP
jgi:hypothetical protein